MTVAQLRASMSIEEETQWMEYHTMLGEEQKRRLDEMKQKTSGPQYKRGRR